MQRARSESSSAKSANPSSQDLGVAIENLLRTFAAVRRETYKGPDLSGTRPASWEDEEYQYIEAKVNHGDVSFCDISIMEGKVFIRIAREDEFDDSPDCLPLLACLVPVDLSLKA